MSIRIIPQQQLSQASNRVSIIREPELVILPNLKTLYTRRHQRTQTTDNADSFADYLNFCGKIIEAQQQIAQQQLSIDFNSVLAQSEKNSYAPLSIENLPLTEQWQAGLHVITKATTGITPQIDEVINSINQLSSQQLNQTATYLLTGEFEQITAEQALFIWSALSVYYTQLASQLPIKTSAQFGEQRVLCPICNRHPVGSVVHLGKNSGLRYLHCSLCESEWYVPRVKCTHCDNMQDINYYSLDDELAAIKSECCSQCHSYLKVFNLELEPKLDILVDDIATLMLDNEMEKLGFAKSGLNPLLFSSTK